MLEIKLTVLTARSLSSKELPDPAYRTQIGPRFGENCRTRTILVERGASPQSMQIR